MRSIETHAGPLFLTFGLATALGAQTAHKHARPEQGDKVPAISLQSAASGAKTDLNDLIGQGPQDVPLLLAFVHRDKALCARFVEEIAKEARSLGDAKARCAIHLVFSGEERSGAAIDAAKDLQPPFHLMWDPDRSAYQTMGLIAFPTVYLIDRKTQAISVLRRGYKISLAQEMVSRLKVALGMMTSEQFDRMIGPTDEVPPEVEQRRTLLREAQALLRTGKPKEALETFEQVLRQDPAEPEAIVGRALASRRLRHKDAFALLQGARGVAPDEPAVALALAAEWLERDRVDRAEPLIRGALEARPAAAWYLLGTMYEKGKRWKEAADAYRESARRSVPDFLR